MAKTKNPMPNTKMTQAKSMAEQACDLGPNPANRMEHAFHRGSPPRFEGDFTPGRNATQKKYILWKPTGSERGNAAKKV